MESVNEAEGLWLNEAMLNFNKNLHKGVLNIINAPAGSGKSRFIFKKFLEESYKYVNGLNGKKYIDNLDKVLYVCDTNMLKSSILSDNEGTTKILEKGDLKEAMETKTFEDILEGNIGYIKIITYSTLGWLLQQKGSRHILLNYFDVIIMDEMHNLFKYANRFDNEENGKPYGTVIEYLSTLIDSKILLVALSATTGRIYNGIRELDINTNIIFKFDERKQIKQYHEEIYDETNCIKNELKMLGLRGRKIYEKNNYKALIYTNTIKQSMKYKEFLINSGFKVEWLCSINNTSINANKEKVSTMNKCQIELRKSLIETGMLPDDLDILIINSGYETGWNLRDKRVQYVYVDSTDEDTQIQVRNRVRHNIIVLVVTVRTATNGEVLEYGQYRQDEYSGRGITTPILAHLIEEKYIGVKLTNEDKKYLVDKYAIQWYDQNTTNWKSFKIDLEKCGFVVETKSNGTYIYKKEEYEKLKSNKEGKLNMGESLIKWLENEWDKKRITCQDVMDVLDIGRKTFDKIINNDDTVQYFKEHRYKVGNIKNSRTKYLMKY